MGYAQWVRVTLKTVSDGTLQVKEATTKYGKWYKATPAPEGDKDTEVASPGGASFNKASPFVFATCGRQDSPSGAEGSVEIWDGDTQVVTIYWDCPYIGSNSLKLTNQNNAYIIQQKPSSVSSSGAIGNVEYTIVKL